MDLTFRNCMSQVFWCDVHFLCCGQLFKAHKTVLSSVSPFLRDLLLAQPLQESPTIITLPDFNLEAFSALLHYIYNGEVYVPNKIVVDFFLIIKSLGIILSDDEMEKIKEAVLEQEHEYKPNNILVNVKDDFEQKSPYLDESVKDKRLDFENILKGEKIAKSTVFTNNNYDWKISRYKEKDVITEPRSDLIHSQLVHQHCKDKKENPLPKLNFMTKNNDQYTPSIFEYENRIAISYEQHFNRILPRINGEARRNDGIIRPTALRPIPTLVPISPNTSLTDILPSTSLLDLSSPNNLPQNLCQNTLSVVSDFKKSLVTSISGPWFSKPPLAYKPVKPKHHRNFFEAEIEKPPPAEPKSDEVVIEINDSNNNLNRSDDNSSLPAKHTCQECGKHFSQLRNYKYHLSVHRGTKEFAATCTVCGKHFNDRGYLSSHMKIHRNRKEYQCPHCPKSFNQRVAYNMHVRIHTGIKPHVCDECGKAFSRKMLLKQHLRTHSGEKPYACSVCDKRFADRSNMTLHLRLHSGVKPFTCDLCPKSFTKKHHLKTHLNYHTGIKPYSCPKCQLAFSQSSNMRTHLKKCTGIQNKD